MDQAIKPFSAYGLEMSSNKFMECNERCDQRKCLQYMRLECGKVLFLYYSLAQ